MEQIRRLLSRPRRQQARQQEAHTNSSPSITQKHQLKRRMAHCGPGDEVLASPYRHQVATRRQHVHHVQKLTRQPPVHQHKHEHNQQTSVDCQDGRRRAYPQGASDSFIFTALASPVATNTEHFPPLTTSVKIPASSVWSNTDSAKVLCGVSGAADNAGVQPPNLWKDPETWPRDAHRLHHADLKREIEFSRLNSIMDSTEYPPLARETCKQESNSPQTSAKDTKKGSIRKQEYVFSVESIVTLEEEAHRNPPNPQLHHGKNLTESEDLHLQHPKVTTASCYVPFACAEQAQVPLDSTRLGALYAAQSAVPSSCSAPKGTLEPCEVPPVPTRPLRIGRLRDHPPVGKLGHHYAQDAPSSTLTSTSVGTADAPAAAPSNSCESQAPKVLHAETAAAFNCSAHEISAEAAKAQDGTPSTCADSAAPASPRVATSALEGANVSISDTNSSTKGFRFAQKQSLQRLVEQRHCESQSLLLSARKKPEAPGGRFALRFRPIIVASGASAECRPPVGSGLETTKNLAGSRRARGAVVLLRQRSSLRMVESVHHAVRQRSRPQWIAKQQQHQQKTEHPQEQGVAGRPGPLTSSKRQDNEFWKRKNCGGTRQANNPCDLMTQQRPCQVASEGQRQHNNSKVALPHGPCTKRLPKQLQHLRTYESHLRQSQQVAYVQHRDVRSAQQLQPSPHHQSLQGMPAPKSNPPVVFGEPQPQEAKQLFSCPSPQLQNDKKRQPAQRTQRQQPLSVSLSASGSTEWVRVMLQQYAAGGDVENGSWHPLFSPPQHQMQYYDGPWTCSDPQHLQRNLCLDNAAVPASTATAEAPQLPLLETSSQRVVSSTWSGTCSVSANGSVLCLQQSSSVPPAPTIERALSILTLPPLDVDRRWSLRLSCGCACSSGCCCSGSACTAQPFALAAATLGGICTHPPPFAPCCDGLRFPGSSAPCALLSHQIHQPTAPQQQGPQPAQRRFAATNSVVFDGKHLPGISLEQTALLQNPGSCQQMHAWMPEHQHAQEQQKQQLQNLEVHGVVSDESGKGEPGAGDMQSDRCCSRHQLLGGGEATELHSQGQVRHFHLPSESPRYTRDIPSSRSWQLEAKAFFLTHQEEPERASALSGISTGWGLDGSSSSLGSSSEAFAPEKTPCMNARCHLTLPFCRSVRPPASIAACMIRGDKAINSNLQPSPVQQHEQPEGEDTGCLGSRTRSSSPKFIDISKRVEAALS